MELMDLEELNKMIIKQKITIDRLSYRIEQLELKFNYIVNMYASNLTEGDSDENPNK